MKRLLIWAAVLMVLAALVWLALRPTPLQVELAQVERGRLESTVDEDGRTRARDRFVVSAPVSGELQRVELEEGDRVERGQVVALLQPAPSAPLDPRSRSELQQRLRAAQATASRAEAAVEFARSELARVEQLVATGAAARRSLEEAQLREREAARQLDAARATASALRAQLGLGGRGGGSIELLAPAAGRVLRVQQESAAVVGPGTPVLVIGDADDLEVVTDVLSQEAVAISAGAPVIVDRWGGDRPLRGRVRRVEPAAFTKISALGVEEQRVNVITELLDPPEARPGLGDGYRVETRIVTWSGEEVLQIPLGALFRQGESWAVFVEEAGRAQQREVGLGHRGERRVQVLEGLEEGERVVVYPGDRIASGTLIEAR